MSSWLAVWKITSATPTVPPLRHLAAGLVAQEAHDLGYLVARLQRDVAAVRDVLAATTSQLGNGLLKGARRSLQRQRIALAAVAHQRSEEHTSELQSLMRISYAVFCLKKKK